MLPLRKGLEVRAPLASGEEGTVAADEEGGRVTGEEGVLAAVRVDVSGAAACSSGASDTSCSGGTLRQMSFARQSCSCVASTSTASAIWRTARFMSLSSPQSSGTPQSAKLGRRAVASTPRCDVAARRTSALKELTHEARRLHACEEGWRWW
ncbi:hypothetical protein AB1Y20_017701 [Prymnesium parvum]|uniref:Uncharacterized protein n=1 Tax=Prymnesium parvum TaxID=97485 RepID=A0AB34JLC6_PRYPA